MNFYVDVISKTIDYIEDSIGDKLSVYDLSKRFGISAFHFNRMFKTVSGITMKQYILGRKLTIALERLKKTNHAIIDIALDLGFEYPEVFSRAFKKQFGVSPTKYRKSTLGVEGIPKACIIEREIINYKGTFGLKGNSVFLEDLSLRGIFVKANTKNEDFQKNLKAKLDNFIITSSETDLLNQETFYTVVNCHGEENGEYTVFCGRKPADNSNVKCFEERLVPKGWYVCFEYYGDMYDIREVFIDDLYRWIIVKEVELNSNGIGMVNIYQKNYPDNNNVKILIPVKKLYSQQKKS